MRRERRYYLRAVAGMAVAAVVLGFLGPYGTYAGIPAGRRVLYWVFAVFGVGFFIMLAQELADRLVPPSWPTTVRLALVVAVASLPGTFYIAFLDLRLGAGSSQPFAYLYLSIVVVSAVLTPLLNRFGRGTPAAAPSIPQAVPIKEETRSPPDAAAAFLLRVAPKLAGGRLLALEAEDHYLRVHSDAGSELVLLRMRDAVTMLEGVAGRQVHRSFWVADPAVRAVRRDGTRLLLELVNGLEVPVSRTQAAALREAGWLDRVGSAAL